MDEGMFDRRKRGSGGDAVMVGGVFPVISGYFDEGIFEKASRRLDSG